MFERPEAWKYKLKPNADSPLYDIRLCSTNTITTAVPRLLEAIVPPEHIPSTVRRAVLPPYTNPDKFWLRVVFEAIYEELKKPKHGKELERKAYAGTRKLLTECWQTYMDCPNECLPKNS